MPLGGEEWWERHTVTLAFTARRVRRTGAQEKAGEEHSEANGGSGGHA